jgi:hypothetical protein
MIPELTIIRESALAAMVAGNYVLALDFAERAMLLISTMPSRTSLDDEEIEWSPEAIKTMVDLLKRKVAEQRANAADNGDGILFSSPGRFIV